MIRAGSLDHKKRSGWFRLGLIALAVSAAYPGIWALGWPRSFFTRFPGFGLEWVGSLPPYNEHLVRDVGSFYVAFAVLFCIAAWMADVRTVRAALVAWLVFSIPHVVWHSQHLTDGAVSDRWGPVVTLGAGIVLAVVLLFNSRRR
jgi:hypothetical protein